MFLLTMSLWFYGYFNASYILILLGSIVCNFLFSRGLLNCKKELKKCLLTLAVSFNLGLLFYFKYYNFFIENVNVLFQTDLVMKNILLPLGISFFTFQQLSYIIDSYHGEIPQYDFLNYASYVAYFPQLVAGPIVSHDELIPQYMEEDRKKINWENISRGLYIFVCGLGKKILLADKLGNVVNWGFSNIADLGSSDAVFVMLAYTFQIYLDFSGYCDMAVGLGKMMNFDLPLNFDSPYKSCTIVEFWDRWHITLTRFFTKYVYIPLGGNRRGRLRTYLNIMVVFLLSGLWHGASWSFVLWGFFHGIFSVITRRWQLFFERIPKIIGWGITFLFLNLTWVLFRAETVYDAWTFGSRIFEFDFNALNNQLIYAFWIPLAGRGIIAHVIMWAILLFVLSLMGLRNSFEKMEMFVPNIRNVISLSFLLFLCSVCPLI